MNNESDSILCTICGGIAHEVHDEKTQWLECGNNENHFATFWTHEWIDANMGEKTESGLLSPLLQKELEAHYSGAENFRKMYMCTFEPDPQVEECVKFLQRTLLEDIRMAKRDNYFTPEVYKEAQKILNRLNRF